MLKPVEMHGLYVNPFLPLTYEQALELVENRDNGMWYLHPMIQEATESTTIAYVGSEWQLEELEALTIVLRHRYNLPSTLASRPVPDRDDPHFGHMLSAVAMALQMHPDGTVDGYSAGKGGRAWIDGSWSIVALELLCIRIRQVAGEHARGAVDSLVTDEWSAATQDTVGDPDWTESNLLWSEKEMLWLNRHGIHMGGAPRLRELFDSHKTKGWSLPRIVCAANEYVFPVMVGDFLSDHTAVMPSARHCDRLMADNSLSLLGGTRLHLKGERQGFIDQHCNFHTREEAWLIANAQNQILREDGGRPGRLYSEHLY